MNQKQRLEIIRQKHEREQKKKKILIHRIIFAAGILIVLLIIIFGIKGCVSSISERAEQKRQEEAALQATPVPTIEPTVNPNEISETFYANSAFIGNSFVDGISIYNFFNDADYFAKIGLSVEDALTTPTQTGTVPVVDELNSDKKYNKIFMMFGENELGWRSKEKFIEKYGEIIDKAKEYQPQSKIYLLAITPVTKTVSDKNTDSTNNEQILVYNELIEKLATDKGVIYADIHKAVANQDGVLEEGAASDGIHFGKDYYEKCLLYIQNNNL